MSENPYDPLEVNGPDIPPLCVDDLSKLKPRVCVTLALGVLIGMFWPSGDGLRNPLFPYLLLGLVLTVFGLLFVTLHDGYTTGAHAPRSIFRGLLIPWVFTVYWVLYYFLWKRPRYFKRLQADQRGLK